MTPTQLLAQMVERGREAQFLITNADGSKTARHKQDIVQDILTAAHVPELLEALVEIATYEPAAGGDPRHQRANHALLTAQHALTQVTQERDTANEAAANAMRLADEQYDKAQELEGERDTARAALKRWGRHERPCPGAKGFRYEPCTCGLSEAIGDDA